MSRPNHQQSIEVHRYTAEGYRPLVFYGDWQVALLNWEPIFDADKLGDIERHKDCLLYTSPSPRDS